jgi:hypothetical protein
MKNNRYLIAIGLFFGFFVAFFVGVMNKLRG